MSRDLSRDTDGDRASQRVSHTPRGHFGTDSAGRACAGSESLSLRQSESLSLIRSESLSLFQSESLALIRFGSQTARTLHPALSPASSSGTPLRRPAPAESTPPRAYPWAR